MDCQNRESFKAFPGVRINVSDTGISTTVSAASLRMSLNARGFAKPEELSGAGAHKLPNVIADGAEGADSGRHFERLELPHTSCVRSALHREEIKNADVRELTSPGLASFKEIVCSALNERAGLLERIEEFQTQERCVSDRISRLGGGSKDDPDGTIARLWREASLIHEHVEEEEQHLRRTFVATNIAVSDEAAPLFEKMCHSFASLSANSVSWDTVSLHRGLHRSKIDLVDSDDVDRVKVIFREDKFDILECRWNVPHLQNVNGGDVFIYPGFLVYYIDDKNFSVIELSEMKAKIHDTFFVESGPVPPNTVTTGVVQRIRADYANPTDGNEDVNREMPICKYASFSLSSKGGLHEEYLISNYPAAKEFCEDLSALIEHFSNN